MSGKYYELLVLFFRTIISSFFLGIVVAFALFENFSKTSKPLQTKFVRRRTRTEDFLKPHMNEQVSNNVKYYASLYGYHYEEYRVPTEDGYLLLVQRIVKKDISEEDKGKAHGHPIILQHGLFMSSGVFVTSEHDSFAFYLAEKGYDVWLGNNRGVKMEISDKFYHSKRTSKWDWTIDDLAQYDMPAIVNFVLEKTNAPFGSNPKHKNVTWIGHSQGNAQGFMALSTNEDLQKKLLLFVALAPTAHVGDLPSRPLHFLKNEYLFNVLFGYHEFIPMINFVLSIAPSKFFSMLGYNMFNYLFKWSDHKWDKSRKPKYFQFAGHGCSCSQIKHWVQITQKGRLFNYKSGIDYPIEKITTPTAIFHGELDELANINSYLSFIGQNRDHIRSVERFEDYEHCDLIWALDSRTRVFDRIHHLVSEEHSRSC